MTAFEISPGTLARLRAKAEAAGVRVETIEGDASAPGRSGFDAAVEHHGTYGAELLAHLPLAGGASPERLVELVESSSWEPARLACLREVERAARRALPTAIERRIGVAPRFSVVAGA